jgi:hypothetical protein
MNTTNIESLATVTNTTDLMKENAMLMSILQSTPEILTEDHKTVNSSPTNKAPAHISPTVHIPRDTFVTNREVTNESGGATIICL